MNRKKNHVDDRSFFCTNYCRLLRPQNAFKIPPNHEIRQNKFPPNRGKNQPSPFYGPKNAFKIPQNRKIRQNKFPPNRGKLNAVQTPNAGNLNAVLSTASKCVQNFAFLTPIFYAQINLRELNAVLFTASNVNDQISFL